MALEECKECDGQVSTSADTCPHCGTKAPTTAAGCAALASSMQTCGCLLTLVVTVPILLAMCFG